MTHKLLRQQYPEFLYESSSWEVTHQTFLIDFYYSVAQHHFHHAIEIPINQVELAGIDHDLLDQLVFSLGLVELLSYWKAFASPKIQVEAGNLTQSQLIWWQDLLIRGMGEYFFVNQIDFTDPNFVTFNSMTLQSSDRKSSNPWVETENIGTGSLDINRNSFLIPIGGGKDSLVTLELLRANIPSHLVSLLLVNPTQAATKIAEHSQFSTIEVRRQLDTQLFELNKQGFLNGHVPFSATLAFLSVFVAYLYDIKQVVFSNEASANEPSLSYLGQEINHQYSKSFEFEKNFRSYLRNISRVDCSLPNYFSLLRPLNELQIAKLFARHGQSYFNIFRSCNQGSKSNIWCRQCSKCLFAYLMLSPWLDELTLVQIFGENLLDNANLYHILQALVGLTPDKPLECVGLRDESLVACYLIYRKRVDSQQPLPNVIERVISQFSVGELELLSQSILKSWNLDHFLPLNLAKVLQSENF